LIIFGSSFLESQVKAEVVFQNVSWGNGDYICV
jgi:hypothetical protein